MSARRAFRRGLRRQARRGALARLLRCAAGVSATEFALVAPVLVLGAFGTADVGMAIYQKMMIGQALRAGAQSAMAGANEDGVRAVVEQIASENFTLAVDGQAQEDALSVDVSIYCACPGQDFAQVGCITLCDGGITAVRFYRLTATKTFSGVLLPAFGLDGSIDVADG